MEGTVSLMASGNTRKGQGSGGRSHTSSGTRKTASSPRGARTASGRKNTAGKKEQAKEESFLGSEIILIISFALCILLFLCNFSLLGPFGSAVKKVMFGMFGVVSFVIPIALFIGIAFRISNVGRRGATLKIFAAILILWCIAIFAEMIAVPMDEISGNLITDLFQESMDGYKGGGLLGGLLAYPMIKYLTKVGTVLILLVVMIIAIIIISERSLINGIRKKGRHVYDNAREKAERREREREIRRQGREEDEEEDEETERAERKVRFHAENTKLRREDEEREAEKSVPRSEKIVSGISEDTLLTPKRSQPIHRENMHEITLADLAEEVRGQEPAAQKPVDDSAFSFDLRSIPEPRGKDIVRDESTVTLSAQAQDIKEIYVDEEPIHTSARGGDVSERVTEPVNTHSFGIKEPYRTPDEKKHAEAVIPNMKPMPKPKKYIFPPINLLKKGVGKGTGDSAKQLKETAAKLQQILKTYGVNVTITDISQGPTVTRYEMQPELGVKVSKIVSLADDIKLNLAATDIRIEAPIPGKAAVGIEVPNKENSAVNLRDLFEADEFKSFPSNISFAVGKDIGGQTIVFDIGKMPHVLIAGSTGSGKSVCINTLIMSILYKAHPDDVKLIMVDPKVVELSVYNGIPHLLIPVVTDPKKAAAALQWAVAEMTERYKKFADCNVRDLKGYNKLAESAGNTDDPSAPQKMPQIVIIVDELADLMMVASGDVEEAIVRLAQLARAAGIHLVIATQRPSVDVITGLIKANMPSRIAFAVSSGVDSRTILDMNGAEKLLGKGDMLFYPQGYSKPVRVQGAFVSDKEVSDVVQFLKDQEVGGGYGSQQQIEDKISGFSSGGGDVGISGASSDADELFAEAGRFIIEKDKASIGMLQRAFRIGFNRAARIMDQLAEAGVVGEEEGTKPRKILMSISEFEDYLSSL